MLEEKKKVLFMPEEGFKSFVQDKIYCHCKAEDQIKLFMCKRSLSALGDEEWLLQKKKS